MGKSENRCKSGSASESDSVMKDKLVKKKQREKKKTMKREIKMAVRRVREVLGMRENGIKSAPPPKKKDD